MDVDRSVWPSEQLQNYIKRRLQKNLVDPSVDEPTEDEELYDLMASDRTLIPVSTENEVIEEEMLKSAESVIGKLKGREGFIARSIFSGVTNVDGRKC